MNATIQTICDTCGVDTSLEWWTDAPDAPGAQADLAAAEFGHAGRYCTPCAAKYEVKRGLTFVLVPDAS